MIEWSMFSRLGPRTYLTLYLLWMHGLACPCTPHKQVYCKFLRQTCMHRVAASYAQHEQPWAFCIPNLCAYTGSENNIYIYIQLYIYICMFMYICISHLCAWYIMIPYLFFSQTWPWNKNTLWSKYMSHSRQISGYRIFRKYKPIYMGVAPCIFHWSLKSTTFGGNG